MPTKGCGWSAEMSGLTKARMYEITSARSGATVGNPIDVQFNPASLKLSLNNTVEGGKTRPQQVRQFVGKGSTDLSFELVFDTADETTADGTPRSVRERTGAIERFVVAKGNGKQKQTPPKVRFQWGNLIVDGIISSLSIDFSLFAPNGVPLRAKMSVTIREQDSRYMFLESGAGANQGASGSASFPGGSSAGGTGVSGGGAALGDLLAGVASAADTAARAAGLPGTSGGGPTDRTAAAIAGESVADFAARNGLSPSAWRALANGVDNPLSLPAGKEIDFSSALGTQSLAPGNTPVASAPATVSEALGLDPHSARTLAGGRALASAGGVTAALATAAATGATQAAARERRAFGTALRPTDGGTVQGIAAPVAAMMMPLAPVTAAAPASDGAAAAAVAALSAPDQPRLPLRLCDEPIRWCTAGSDTPGIPAALPYIDARALTFGFGVPLRPTVGAAVQMRASLTRGGVTLRHGSRADDALQPRDAAAAPWVHLPRADAVRGAADRASSRANGTSHCACDPHSHGCGGPSCQCTSGK